MAGEVTWEDEGDVREIIADVRDAECEMTWCVALAGVLCLPRAPCVSCTREIGVAADGSVQDKAVQDIWCRMGTRMAQLGQRTRDMMPCFCAG
jgi:hypothetical protein